MRSAKQILIGNGLDQSFWGKRIIAAQCRGGFLGGDVLSAGNWTTCACGQQDPRIPRDRVGEPLDTQLAGNGLIFNHQVANGHYSDAAETLVAIEKRAGHILAELEAKP